MRLLEVILARAAVELEPSGLALRDRARRWARSMGPVDASAVVSPAELSARLVSAPPWIGAIPEAAGRPVFLVSRSGDLPLDAVGRGAVAVLAASVYARVHRREQRIALLGGLAARVGDHGLVGVRARVTTERTQAVQLALDLPRHVAWAVARKAGYGAAPEWGDRLRSGGDSGLVLEHLFFSADALVGELAMAGLAPLFADGELVVCRLGRAVDEPQALAREIAQALRVLPAVERARRRAAPAEAIAWARTRGARAPRRGPLGRARLEHAIAWVDAAVPTGPSCYRRTLLETALDRGAAEEKIALGLDVGATGHAWIVPSAGRVAERPRDLDVVFEV